MNWKSNAVWGKIYAYIYNTSVTQPDGFNRKYLDIIASKIWIQIFGIKVKSDVQLDLMQAKVNC